MKWLLNSADIQASTFHFWHQPFGCEVLRYCPADFRLLTTNHVRITGDGHGVRKALWIDMIHHSIVLSWMVTTWNWGWSQKSFKLIEIWLFSFPHSSSKYCSCSESWSFVEVWWLKFFADSPYLGSHGPQNLRVKPTGYLLGQWFFTRQTEAEGKLQGKSALLGSFEGMHLIMASVGLLYAALTSE